ncbi:hypothetical protein L1987_84490 [Smallanthus sonchifolius]|uniref:Uncharacterized protein n=1 Tax=Smallanthus sonchifolius TaxID=185202 RepID=A0ACB8YFH1_9ASTR|nr:hypothetical protein L1987_84490 [Smallanthus sonchifolius]
MKQFFHSRSSGSHTAAAMARVVPRCEGQGSSDLSGFDRPVNMEVEQPLVDGVNEPPCMGKENDAIINATPNNEIINNSNKELTKSQFHFESGNAGDSLTHNRNPNPNVRETQLPDLNNSLGGISSEALVDGTQPHSSACVDRSNGKNGDTMISEEIEATKRIGKELGVNLENMDDLERKVIEGERVTSVIQ